MSCPKLPDKGETLFIEFTLRKKRDKETRKLTSNIL